MATINYDMLTKNTNPRHDDTDEYQRMYEIIRQKSKQCTINRIKSISREEQALFPKRKENITYQKEKGAKKSYFSEMKEWWTHKTKGSVDGRSQSEYTRETENSLQAVSQEAMRM